MTERLDAGPILAQHAIPLALESRYREVEAETIDLGAELALEVLGMLKSDPARGSEQPEGVWFEPHPGPGDLIAGLAWPAERVFRFVRGTGTDYGPIALALPDGEELWVRDALQLYADRRIGVPVTRHGQLATVQFSDGAITFQLAAASG
jgi:methionyl-tRNA formyltransferase